MLIKLILNTVKLLMKKKSYTNKHLKNGGVRLLIKFTVKKWMKFTPEFSKSMV